MGCYEVSLINNSKGYGLDHLNRDEIIAIHTASIEVLEKIGVKVDDPTAFTKFKDNGCYTDEKKRVVRIPDRSILTLL